MGDQPDAKPVFDLDSMTLLSTARILCDEARFLSGRKLESPPKLFLGAASNPFVPPLDFRPLRLAKKANAGAQFIQTQFCFDVPRMHQFMAAVRDLGLDKRIFILVGVGPLRSAKSGKWIRNNVPGVIIPDQVSSNVWKEYRRTSSRRRVNVFVSRSSNRCGRSPASAECTSWPTGRRSWWRRS